MTDEDEFLIAHCGGELPARRALRESIGIANGPAAIAMRQPVLLLGESGVGKGHTAELISAHRAWGALAPHERMRYLVRRDPLTISVYRSLLLVGIPELLIESELFGHKRGSFTGAAEDKEGVFASSTVKDLLLDEIGDASLLLQEKLLEVVDTGEFRPVGAPLDQKEETAIRLILATNRDLTDRVRIGRFRHDLYWRVAQLIITIPPLRAQRKAISEIATSVRARVLDSISENRLRSELANRTLTEKDLVWAGKHEWPGNVRELTRLIRLWLILPEALPLKEVNGMFPVSVPTDDSAQAEELLSMGTEKWWREIVAGTRPPAKSLEDLLRQLTAVLKGALVGEGCPADEYAVVLRDQDKANISSRVSKWRRANR